MEVYVDDETKLTLHGLTQHYCKLKDSEKNRKLFDLLDALEFNQVVIFFDCAFLNRKRIHYFFIVEHENVFLNSSIY